MNKNKNKKIISIVLVFALIIVLVLFISNNKNEASKPTNQPTSSADGDINFSAPSEEDNKNTEARKQEIIEKSQNPSANPSGANVQPIITYSEKYGNDVETAAYVQGVSEEGGTCTATYSKNGQSKEAKVTAFANSGATNCPPMIISASSLGSGTWQVKVTYKSATRSGVSEVRSIEVK